MMLITTTSPTHSCRLHNLLPLRSVVASRANLPTQQVALLEEQLKASKAFQLIPLQLRKLQEGPQHKLRAQLQLAQEGLRRLVVVIL